MATETFGDRFSRLIDEAGLSAMDVCAIVGWKSESSYYKARRGDASSMNALGLLRLARKLNVTPYYLVSEPEPGAEPRNREDRMKRLESSPLAKPHDVGSETESLEQQLATLRSEMAELRGEMLEKIQASTLGWVSAAEAVRGEIRAARPARARAQ